MSIPLLYFKLPLFWQLERMLGGQSIHVLVLFSSLLLRYDFTIQGKLVQNAPLHHLYEKAIHANWTALLCPYANISNKPESQLHLKHKLIPHKGILLI